MLQLTEMQLLIETLESQGPGPGQVPCIFLLCICYSLQHFLLVSAHDSQLSWSLENLTTSARSLKHERLGIGTQEES